MRQLERLLHRSVVFNIDGESYRMRSHRARAENPLPSSQRRAAPPNINPHPPSRSPGNFVIDTAIAGIIARPKSELRRRAGVSWQSSARFEMVPERFPDDF